MARRRGPCSLLVGAVVGLCLALSCARVAHAEDEVQDALLRDKLAASHTPLGIHWDEGMYFVTKPKTFTLRLNWRFDMDYVFVDDDAYVDAGGRLGDTPSAFVLRRARFTAAGVLGRHSHWKLSVEATESSGGLRDNYFDTELTKEWFGEGAPRLRMGNFFEPYSLEQNTPSGRITFMERAAPTQAIAPGRSLGIMVYDVLRNGRMGYAVGVFASPITKIGGLIESVHDDTLGRDGYAVTGRYWWMPIRDCRCTCRRLMVGVCASQRFGMSGIAFRTRPESYLFDFVVDTDYSTDALGTPLLDDASAATLLGLQASWVSGRWFVQGEYYASRVSSLAGGDPVFRGGYAMVGCWLTGECRQLEDGHVLPNQICSPLNPCDDREGLGGIELAARLSTVDLNDARIAGGTMTNLSLELNWHLRGQRRLMFNFVRAGIDDGIADEPIYIFQMRLQLSF